MEWKRKEQGTLFLRLMKLYCNSEHLKGVCICQVVAKPFNCDCFNPHALCGRHCLYLIFTPEKSEIKKFFTASLKRMCCI